MKGMIEFNLDNRDDDMAMKRCHKSLQMAWVIWYFTIARSKFQEFKTPEDVFNYFNELLEKYSIDINDLVE